MKLLIVESPAKAKTINKYLGKDFKVLASFGHIRDLPSKDGSVDPGKDFSFVWEIAPSSEKHVKEIVSALKDADALYLATDPDREGEAISWHLVEELKRRKKIAKDLPVYRVTFNEITKSAVLDALKHPRAIDQMLVDAYLARRALDYLVGFSLSPILWRKLPGSRSAGRVQSVALKLISEREDDIKAFVSEEYWTIDALFHTPEETAFNARLIQLDGIKLEKFSIPTKADADTAAQKIKAADFSIASVEKKRVKRYPAPPFTTSTLQQEASRKLYFSARKTMTLAQELYEGETIGGETIGLITYMRTDGVSLSQEAINGARSQIGKTFGDRYVPEKPVFYKNKTANAQEAHEAIRPTSFTRTPDQMRTYLSPDAFKLYDLIYKRAIASQMTPAEMDRVTADVSSRDHKTVFRATGQTVAFDGFLKVYFESFDDRKKDEDDDAETKLPPLTEGSPATPKDIRLDQHFTEPPPRYSEASLVKKLEELGIGRPSTYASIISVLQDRNYVRLEDRRFIPEERGRIVTQFLDHFFSTYIRYDFTADLEKGLDDIAEGRLDYLKLLHTFWKDFSKTVEAAGSLKFEDVLRMLEQSIGKDLFKTEADRVCPQCQTGRLSLKLGKFGAFVGCSRYPDCKYTRPLDPAAETSDKDFDGIALKKGQYGYYLEKDDKKVSLPRSVKPDKVTPETAAFFFSLPKVLGQSDAGDDVVLAVGMFGPYIKSGKLSKSVPTRFNLPDLTLSDALEILSTAKPKPEATVIGQHPTAKKEITYAVGRFGPYVKMGKTIASLPKAMKEAGNLPTLAEAAALIDAKTAKTPAKAKAKAKTSKTVKTKK